ncbi:MAG: hypothetical protein P8182_11990, partial [Deltaproteobacteria bacterium]
RAVTLLIVRVAPSGGARRLRNFGSSLLERSPDGLSHAATNNFSERARVARTRVSRTEKIPLLNKTR